MTTTLTLTINWVCEGLGKQHVELIEQNWRRVVGLSLSTNANATQQLAEAAIDGEV